MTDQPATTSTPSKETKKKGGKVIRRNLKYGIIYVNASSNNTIVTVADTDGETVAQTSAGKSGFKGSRKSTPYAAQISAEKAAEVAKTFGIEEVDVVVKGIGNGREQAIRGLIGGGLVVNKIIDRTAVAHNGCRKRRPRRV